MKLVMSAIALASLAACGGAGTDLSPQVPTLSQFEASVRSFGATAERIDLLEDTGPNKVTLSTGTSTFRGPALLSVRSMADQYSMTGDSRLTINFANGNMNGGVTNLIGVNQVGRRVDVTGGVTYTDGDIGTGDNRGLFLVEYNGDLTAGSDQIAMEGIAVGQFEGNRTAGDIRMKALQATSGTSGSITVNEGLPVTMIATMNGNFAVADFAFVGEN